MKAICLAAAAAVAITVCAAATPSAAVPTLAFAAQPDEVSAASRRHVSRKQVRRKAYVTDSRSPYYLRPGVKPSFGYIGPPGYAGEYAWRKSIGQCVEDLGYGRWAACGYQ